jgi:hypothetical protein
MSSPAPRTGRYRGNILARGLFLCTATVALFARSGVAHSGPCTAQIAALEQQIKVTPVGPKSARPFRKHSVPSFIVNRRRATSTTPSTLPMRKRTRR